MTGITSYGAYLPTTRLALGALGGREAVPGGPEKAVAWNDEDAVTMAVAAGMACLRGLDREFVDGLIFASTSYAFREKQAAALVARALGLGRDVLTTDIGGSLRAGTSALRIACDTVKVGRARSVLVLASDCRMAAPGSPLEANLGDGAVAFLVSQHDVVAALEETFSVSDEIVDVWRSDGDAFSHSWEDRFVVQEGYTPRIIDAVRGLVEKSDCSLSDYAKVALYGPDKRSHAGAARTLGLATEQIQDPLFGRVGNTGVAAAPLQLAAALERARPDDRLLVASYGDGAEALSFVVGDAIEKLGPRRGVTWHLERRRSVDSYDRYLKARNLHTSEWEASSGPGLSATIHFRERDDDIGFRGQKCRKCSAVQFPAQRICETCFAKDDFDSVRLAECTGKVVTYTLDYFFPTPDPPTVVTVLDIEGARVHMQVVNVEPEKVRPGMLVEFTFRRIHQAGGRPNYYWKGTPLQKDDET